MTESSAVLVFEAVTRQFADGRKVVCAVDDVSLQLERGEMVAVMGPSGSGKSTLLHLAGGLDRPTSGQVHVCGEDLGALSAREVAVLRRREIGVVFQEYNLIEALTSAENVALPLELDGVRRRVARDRAVETLGEVGLADLIDRFPADLSGGERQRVAIARGLVGGQSLLLADEPTGALDSVTGEDVLKLLKRRCTAGATALVVTHEARLAAWADRIVFLRDGRLVEGRAAAVGPERLISTR